MPARPTSTATRALDCARWMAERPLPDLPVPAATYPDEVRTDAGWRVRVALLGGTVDTSHPDLVDARVSTWTGARGPGLPPADPVATAFAALLVGQGRAQVHGLAPAAHLLVAPVQLGPGHAGPGCADRGRGVPGLSHHPTDETMARAVRWAVAESAHVIVLPFGRRRMGRRLADTLRRATAAGAIVFAAAGDLGPRTVSFPASVTGVTAVTGYDDHGVLPQCSRLADVAAPAQDVPGAGPDGVHPLHGSAPATVLAAGAHAAARSKLTLELFGSVHGSVVPPPGDAPRARTEPRESLQTGDERRHGHRLVHLATGERERRGG